MKKLAFVLACVLSIAFVSVGCAGAQPSPTAVANPAATTPPTEASRTSPAAVSPAKDTPTAASPAPAAPAPAKSAPSKQQTAVVKIGMLQGPMAAGAYVGMEKGYFKEQGIEVEVTYFDSGAKIVPAIGTGQVDVSSGGLSAGLFNAVARDIQLRIVAGQTSLVQGHTGMGLVARQDLFDGGQFKDYADLKGKRIGIPPGPGVNDILLDRALNNGGLTSKDVQTVELALGDILTALANKSIDAGFLAEPTLTIAKDRNVATLFKVASEIYPNQQFMAWLYSQQFVEKNPDLGNRFMVGLLRGTRDYNDAFVKKDPKARAEIIPILIKNLPIKDPAMYEKMTAGYLEPNGNLDKKLIDSDQDWYMERGFQKDKINLDKVVDMSFVEYAVKQLGTYK